jgi:hypothetical protein
LEIVAKSSSNSNLSENNEDQEFYFKSDEFPNDVPKKEVKQENRLDYTYLEVGVN